MSKGSPLSDLIDVACLVGKGLAGELSDADLRNPRLRHAPEPAAPSPPPRAAPPPERTCVRCDGEREVVIRSVVVPCPVCTGGR